MASVAHLSSVNHDVAPVHAARTRPGRIPAVVLDVEERTEPRPILAFSALDPLVTERAHTDLDGALPGTLCTFAFAFPWPSPWHFQFFPLPFLPPRPRAA